MLVLVLQGQGQLPNLCFQVLQGSIGVLLKHLCVRFKSFQLSKFLFMDVKQLFVIPHELQHLLLKRLGPLLTLIFIYFLLLLLLLLEPWWMIPLLEILPLSLAL